MDCGQTYDVVDIPPPFWQSHEDFQEHEEILKWRDIQTGTYKVLDLQNGGQNKYGLSVVLKLENAKGATFSVWAPSYFMQWKKENLPIHLEPWCKKIRRN